MQFQISSDEPARVSGRILSSILNPAAYAGIAEKCRLSLSGEPDFAE